MNGAKTVSNQRKYHLKPRAKRLYKRMLYVALLAVVGIIALRLTIFKDTYTLKTYDAGTPFSFYKPLLETVGTEKPEDLIVMNVSVGTGEGMTPTTIQMDLVELLSKNKMQEWRLVVSDGKAKLRKGERVAGNYTQQRAGFPSLQETLQALSRIPFSLITSKKTIDHTKQHFEFTTQNYRPNVNPVFSERVKDIVEVIWVPTAGEASWVAKDWKPVSNYMALDCHVVTNKGKSEPLHVYVVLLSVRTSS